MKERSEPPRAVVNVNVLVSALLRPDGPPGRVVQRFSEGRFEIVASDEIFEELRRALSYRKVRERIALSDTEISLWVAALRVLTVPVDPSVSVRAVAADPDDDKYLSTALEGRASFVVSGDAHLLDLGEYEGIRIVTPRTFLEAIG